jgi:hypothetical protein
MVIAAGRTPLIGAMHFGIFPNLMNVIAKSLASLGLARFPYNVSYIRR